MGFRPNTWRGAASIAAGLLPVSHAVIPDVPGFHLTWGDDFNVNTQEWMPQTGHSYPGGAANWGTGQIENDTLWWDNPKTNVYITKNQQNLAITARKDAAGAWTSARVETKNQGFQCAPGKKMQVQASISLQPPRGDAALGYWFAFWMLGSNFRPSFNYWPMAGEIDIMENVNGSPSVYATLHCGTSPGGPCHEKDGISNHITPKGSIKDFHLYTVEIDRTDPLAEKMTWFVDHVVVHQVRQADLPGEVWAATAHNSFFIILNLAIGGEFPNKAYGSPTPVAKTVDGGTMEVAFVGVYNS